MNMNQKYQKKTILQVVPALISGGVERGTLDIAKRIVEVGHNSIVISAGGPMVESLIDSGSQHITLNASSKNPVTIWKNAHVISNIIRDQKVDIVHVRSRAPAWSCYMAAKATKTKLITTFHGIYSFNNPIKKFYNSIMTEGDKVVAVSNFVKKHIMENYKVDPNKIIVIHRGVDHVEFNQNQLSEDKLKQFKTKYRVPENTPVLLLPARMTSWKGHNVLIDALEKIKHLNFYCILAGDLGKHPAYVSRIQTKIRGYGLQGNVQLFGNERDIINLYGISNIVLSTSVEPEAFGRTIIEAQSMQKLVIATSIGGACETIQDGVNGFHVEPGNSSALAKKIEYCLFLLGSEDEKNITDNARKTASEKFSLDKMLKSVISLYDHVS
jgi:glycosyltransferase involved in cell wall biosynthesis